MIVLVYLAGLVLQITIGYIVLKFIVSIIRSIVTNIIIPTIKAIFTLMWVAVKVVACLMVGGITLVTVIALIA